MTLWRAYVDDSGSDLNDTVSVLVACTSTDTEWDCLEAQWKALLKYWNLDYFKTSEAMSLTGQFDPHRGWNKERRSVCLGDFLKCVVDHKPLGIGVALHRCDFAPAFRHYPYEVSIEYAVLFNSLFVSVVSAMQAYYAQSQRPLPELHFVFDQQDDPGLAQIILRGIQRRLEVSVPVTFAESKKVVQLQCADLLAWPSRMHERGRDGSLWNAIKEFTAVRRISREELDGSMSRVISEEIDKFERGHGEERH